MVLGHSLLGQAKNYGSNRSVWDNEVFTSLKLLWR